MSGNITHDETTTLELVKEVDSGGAELSFDYNTSTESGFDYLELYVNGSFVDEWSGSNGWTTYTTALSAGTNTIEWRYVKDGSVSDGSDTVWVDDVSITPSNPPESAYFGGNVRMNLASSEALRFGPSTADEGLISYDSTTDVLSFETDPTTNGDISIAPGGDTLIGAGGQTSISAAGDLLFSDDNATNIPLTVSDSSLATTSQGIVDAINEINAAASGATTNFDNVYDTSVNDNNLTLEVDSGTLNYNLTGTSDFAIQDNGTPFATFADSGRLGLGTINPSEALHIANGNAKVAGSGYDLSTAEYSGDVFDVDQEALSPREVHFKDDGTKMYVLDTYNNLPIVYEYDLGTPWDQTTATYNGSSADVSGEFTNANGLAFGDSGNKMYVTGIDSDTVVEYDLSTPWDVTTASVTNTLNVGTETDYPFDVSFQDDGSRMFIASADFDFGDPERVLEYDLSSNWSISSASYNTGEDFTYTESSTGSTITFNATGSKMYIAGDGNGVENFVHEFNLSVPWDASSASFNSELYVHHLDVPEGIAFKPDGSKLFGIGEFDFPDNGRNRLVHSYDLTTPFDITTADHSSIDYRVTAQATNPEVVRFGNNGSKMYVYDNNTTNIYAYDLSTPWVPESAAYNGEFFDPSSLEANVSGFHFESDGTSFFLIGADNDTLYEYDLNTPWDLSTIVTPPAQSADLDALTGGGLGNSGDIDFKPDGSKVYVVQSSGGTEGVYAFDLGTNWDVSTISLAEKYNGAARNVVLSSDGSKMYMGDTVNLGEVREYNLSTRWDVSSASATGAVLEVADFDRSITLGLEIKPDGSRLYVLGNNEDTVNVFYMDSAGGNIDVAGNATIGGYIDVDGSATMNDTLSVSGLATFNDVDVAGTLTSSSYVAGSSEFILPTNAGTPSGSTTEGSIVWDSSGDALNVFDGSSFVQLATSSSASDDLDSVYANDADKTLTLNDANGSLTFASTETDNNIVVDLQSTGDFVIQDSGTPAFTLADNGTATFTNLLSAVGDIDLGDQPSDLISFNGQFDTNLIPNADGAVDFGSNGNRINNMYVDSFDGATESPQGLWFGPDANNQANLSYDSNTNTFSILSGVGTSTNPAALELNTQNTGADAIQLSTGGGIDLNSGSTGSDSIDINSNGGVDVDASGDINLTSSNTTSTAIRLNATGTGGGFLMSAEGAGIDMNTANGGDVDLEVDPLGTGQFIVTSGGAAEISSGGGITLDPGFGNGVVLDLDNSNSTAAVCKTGGSTALIGVTLTDCTGTPSADYMEMYPATSDVTTGDLVEIGTTDITTEDGDTIKQITKSTGAYSGKIIGIASNPSEAGDFNSIGYNISDADNPYPVALNGRVKLNVTDQNGAIAPGDPITSSATNGVGMKATQPGMVVGYALEAHTSGNGQIMVFVSPGYHSGTTIANDGTMPTFNSDFAYTKTAQATSTDEGKASHTLMFRGSGWDGSQAKDVAMQVNTQVTDASEYRLSIKDATDSEVAYISNNGKMEIAGDMVVGGKLYPSDRGTPQTDKYIYYDGSSGGAGDMMRTNAGGWSTGSYDFAEMFPSTQELEPGDVVTFAKDEEHVRRTDTANTQTIAGVVSTQPGFLAGENKEGSHPIALAGRVPTKVSMQNGAINVGDPLTSSDEPGVAMRAKDPGMVLGYALEPYNGSTSDDKIVAFINASYYDGKKTDALAGTQNTASQLSFSDNGSSLTSLDMAGNIYMHGNEIRSVGRLVGISDRWSVEEDGTFKTEGSYKVVVESYQGEDVEADSLLTRGQRVFLSGVTKLDNGMATVEFEQEDDKFNDITSTQAPVSVVLTPDGPAQLYITDKNNNGFTIEQMDGTDSGITVNWMVTAYRKGQEPERFLENNNDGTTDDPTQDSSDIDGEEGSDDDENPDSADSQSENDDDAVEEESDDVSNDGNGESADDDGSDEQTSDVDSGTSNGSSSNDETDSGSTTDDGDTNDGTTDGDGSSDGGDTSNDEDDSANSTDSGVDDGEGSTNDDTNTQTDSGLEDAPDGVGGDSGSTEDPGPTDDTDTDTSTNATDDSATNEAGDGSTETATEDGQTSDSTDDAANDQEATDGSNEDANSSDAATDDFESTDGDGPST